MFIKIKKLKILIMVLLVIVTIYSVMCTGYMLIRAGEINYKKDNITSIYFNSNEVYAEELSKDIKDNSLMVKKPEQTKDENKTSKEVNSILSLSTMIEQDKKQKEENLHKETVQTITEKIEVEKDKREQSLQEYKDEKMKLPNMYLGPKTRAKLYGDKTEEEQTQEVVSNNSQSCTGSQVSLALTFYTDTHEENGGWGGYVANNKKIAPGMVASGSQLPFGTKLNIPSFGKHIGGLEGRNTFVVEDRMLESESYKTNGADYRIDIYVPRVDGESTSSYMNRVNSYGRYNVTAYIQ